MTHYCRAFEGAATLFLIRSNWIPWKFLVILWSSPIWCWAYFSMNFGNFGCFWQAKPNVCVHYILIIYAYAVLLRNWNFHMKSLFRWMSSNGCPMTMRFSFAIQCAIWSTKRSSVSTFAVRTMDSRQRNMLIFETLLAIRISECANTS